VSDDRKQSARLYRENNSLEFWEAHEGTKRLDAYVGHNIGTPLR
jgi:hypothetical protein